MKELKLFLEALSNVLGKSATFFNVTSNTLDTRYPILKKCNLKVIALDKEYREEIVNIDKVANIAESTLEDTYREMQKETIEYLLKYYNVQ